MYDHHHLMCPVKLDETTSLDQPSCSIEANSGEKWMRSSSLRVEELTMVYTTRQARGDIDLVCAREGDGGREAMR